MLFEPTDAAVRDASAAIPSGLIGCGIVVAVSLAYSGWTRNWRWALAGVPGLVVAGLLLGEPESHGDPLFAWLVLTIVTAATVIATAILRRRR